MSYVLPDDWPAYAAILVLYLFYLKLFIIHIYLIAIDLKFSVKKAK